MKENAQGLFSYGGDDESERVDELDRESNALNESPNTEAGHCKRTGKAGGKAVTFELHQEQESKLKPVTRNQKRGSLVKGHGFAKTSQDEGSLMPVSLQGAAVVLPDIKLLDDGTGMETAENNSELALETPKLHLPSLLLRNARGRRGSGTQTPADLCLEVMGQDMQLPPPKSLTEPQKPPPKKRPGISSQYTPTLQTFHEVDEEGANLHRTKIDNNLRKVLECHSIGIPLEISRPQFVRARHARPIFHCCRCMDHWARSGKLPPDCEEPEDKVLGPVIELSTKAAQFLQSVWTGDGEDDRQIDAEYVATLRKNLRSLLKQNQKFRKSYSRSSQLSRPRPIHADVYVDSDEEGLSFESDSEESDYSKDESNGGEHMSRKRNRNYEYSRRNDRKDFSPEDGYIRGGSTSDGSLVSLHCIDHARADNHHSKKRRVAKTDKDHGSGHSIVDQRLESGGRKTESRRRKDGTKDHKGRSPRTEGESGKSLDDLSYSESDSEQGYDASDNKKAQHTKYGGNYLEDIEHSHGSDDESYRAEKKERKGSRHRRRRPKKRSQHKTINSSSTHMAKKSYHSSSSSVHKRGGRKMHKKSRKQRKHERSCENSEDKISSKSYITFSDEDNYSMDSFGEDIGNSRQNPTHRRGESTRTESRFEKYDDEYDTERDRSTRTVKHRKRRSIERDEMVYERYAKQGKYNRYSKDDSEKHSPDKSFILPGRHGGAGDPLEDIVDQLLGETAGYAPDGYIDAAKRVVHKPILIPGGSSHNSDVNGDFMYEADTHEVSYNYFVDLNDKDIDEPGENLSASGRQNPFGSNKFNNSTDQDDSDAQKRHDGDAQESGRNSSIMAGNSISGSRGELRGGIAFDIGSGSSLSGMNSSTERGGTSKGRRKREKAIIRNHLVKNKTGKPETGPGQLEKNTMATPATGVPSRRGSIATSKDKTSQRNVSRRNSVGLGKTTSGRSQIGSEHTGTVAQNFDLDALPDAPLEQGKIVPRKTTAIKKKQEITFKKADKAYNSKEVGDLESMIDQGPAKSEERPPSSVWRASSVLPGPGESQIRAKTSNVNTVRMSKGSARQTSAINKRQAQSSSGPQSGFGPSTNGQTPHGTVNQSEALTVPCGTCDSEKDSSLEGEFVVGKRPSTSFEDKTAMTESSDTSSTSSSEKASLVSMSEILKAKRRFTLPDFGGITTLSFTPAFTYSLFEVPDQYRQRNQAIKEGTLPKLEKSKSAPPLIHKLGMKKTKKIGAVGKLAKKMMNRVCDPTPLASYVKKLKPLGELTEQKSAENKIKYGSGDSMTKPGEKSKRSGTSRSKHSKSKIDKSNDEVTNVEQRQDVVVTENTINDVSDIKGTRSVDMLTESLRAVEIINEMKSENNNVYNVDNESHGVEQVVNGLTVLPPIDGTYRGLLGGKESVVFRVQDYDES